MKIKLLSIVVLMTTFFSCQSRNELPAEVTDSLVKIHSINTTTLKGRLFRPLPADGASKNTSISRLPLLENKDIAFSEPFEYMDGVYGLSLRLTYRGGLRSQAIIGNFSGTRLVMLMGSKFKCIIKMGRNGSDPQRVKIAAELSKEEAEDISKVIIRNYEAIKENS
jgi:hypothetical protein